MTAVPTDPIKCPAVDGYWKGKKHAPTVLTGHCETGHHDTCRGFYAHPCGCVVPCRCTTDGHPPDRPHPYEEHPVPLPDPFTIPEEQAPSGQGAKVTTPQVSTEEDWRDTVAWTEATANRPWVDGTGEPGALEVMVRCFALAAGDLHLSDDEPADYDETALLAMLGILRAAVRRAGELDAILVAHLHDHGTWGRRLVEGIGEVRTYRRPKNERWDERGTAMAVIDHHMAETGGEVPDPGTVVAWLLEAASIDYYRVTALTAMGIDPEDYRHREKGTRAVDVPVPD